MTRHGVTEFFSETGTEGGWWAFRDTSPEFYHTEFDLVNGACPWGGEVRLSDGSRACPGMPEYWRGTYRPPKLSHARYEGLHILADGDKLRVYDDKDRTRVVWEGVIELERFEPFSESVWGYWINVMQKTETSRENWAELFMVEHPAELETEE